MLRRVRAERALAQQADYFAESDAPLPEPTPIEQIVLPKQSDFAAFLALELERPNPSERVNIYLPRTCFNAPISVQPNSG